MKFQRYTSKPTRHPNPRSMPERAYKINRETSVRFFKKLKKKRIDVRNRTSRHLLTVIQYRKEYGEYLQKKKKRNVSITFLKEKKLSFATKKLTI
jgi:hypothetical protein